MRELLPRVARVPEEIFFLKIQENGAAKHINLYLGKKNLWYGHVLKESLSGEEKIPQHSGCLLSLLVFLGRSSTSPCLTLYLLEIQLFYMFLI